MPIDLNEYPDHWRQIAYDLKEFNNWKCQFCGKAQNEIALNWQGKPYEIVLACAHLDHDIENPYARLAVLCQACHLSYDRPIHVARAMITWQRKFYEEEIKSGQLILFQQEPVAS